MKVQRSFNKHTHALHTGALTRTYPTTLPLLLQNLLECLNKIITQDHPGTYVCMVSCYSTSLCSPPLVGALCSFVPVSHCHTIFLPSPPFSPPFPPTPSPLSLLPPLPPLPSLLSSPPFSFPIAVSLKNLVLKLILIIITVSDQIRQPTVHHSTYIP